MKWHSAAKAKEAAKTTKGINPGIGSWNRSIPPPQAKNPPHPDVLSDLSPQVQFILNQYWKRIEDWGGNNKLTQIHKELNETCARYEKKTCPKKRDLSKAIELTRIAKLLLPL